MKYTIEFTNDKPSIEVKGESFAEAVSQVVKQGVSLSYAYLKDANLNHANLNHADLDHAVLTFADLRCSDLRYATLYGTNMTSADLVCADLRNTNLRHAKLSQVDLGYAKLEGADLDFSSIPLCCGSLRAKVDKTLAVQALYHACRWLQSVDDEECRNFLKIPEVKKLANQFHRVVECGKI